MLGRTIWRQHLGMDDVALGRKVLHPVDALVAHSRGQTVGGGGTALDPALWPMTLT